MKAISILWKILLVCVVMYLAIIVGNNDGMVQINLPMLYTGQMTMNMMLITGIVIGLVVGIVICVFSLVKLRYTNMVIRAENAKVKKDFEQLRIEYNNLKKHEDEVAKAAAKTNAPALTAA